MARSYRFGGVRRFRLSKASFLSWAAGLVVCGASFAGAYFLGGIYLDIVKGGIPEQEEAVTVEETEMVSTGEPAKTVALTPVPVYYLQAGVYSSVESAQTAAKPLGEAGFEPYIGKTAPYRIWVGFFRQRGDAEPLKARLLDMGISSFTGSTVLNSTDLQYANGSEALVQPLVPFLELCTDWLQQSREIFQTGEVDALNWEAVQGQAVLTQEIYENLQEAGGQIRINSETINLRLADLLGAAENCRGQLEALIQSKTQDDYARLQNHFLTFVDDYLLFREEIDNLSKT